MAMLAGLLLVPLRLLSSLQQHQPWLRLSAHSQAWVA